VKVSGTYFPSKSSRAIAAHAELSQDAVLTITAEDGAILTAVPFKDVRASSRLGKLYRCLDLPGGAHFETSDNDGVDAMFRAAGLLRRGAFIHRLESSLRWVAVAVLLATISATAIIVYGFPAAARWLAYETPRPVLAAISEQTLSTMDRLSLGPSRLTATERAKAKLLFDRVAAVAANGRNGYRLLFRNGNSLGPNAFSLPDGTIIVTDQLCRLVKRNDELEGVFGHELAHANRRHSLQMVYEDSLIPVAIALITGDASQFTQIASVLPAMLIQSSYSRGFELQADDDSVTMMRHIGADPSALGDLLLRMDKTLCGKDGCRPSWLGSHPATTERVARLRTLANSSR